MRGRIGKIRMAGSPHGRGYRIDETPHMKDESIDEGAVEMDLDRVRSRWVAVGDAPALRNPSVLGVQGLFSDRAPAVVLNGELRRERPAIRRSGQRQYLFHSNRLRSGIGQMKLPLVGASPRQERHDVTLDGRRASRAVLRAHQEDGAVNLQR